MSKNIGKMFEEDFSKSVPVYAGLLRIPDAAQSFARSSKLRFSLKNPFDYILWNSRSLTLYALELKTTKEKSISFERTKEDKGIIHWHQIEGLNQFNKVGNCVCGFVIDFRSLEETVFIEIGEFNRLMDAINKKSFTIKDLDSNDIKYVSITKTLVRTRYRYDIENFLKNTALHQEQ